VPNRDVGLQAIGELAGDHLSYAVGVFNGVADLGNGDGDMTNDKDFAARLFIRVGALGLGIGARTGIEHGTVAATGLPSYVTPGQQAMFRYRDRTVANGHRIRFAPQAYWYGGPVGVLGEYVISEQDVTRTTSSRRVAGNSVTSAKAWGAGITWHPAPGERFAVNYERTHFTAGAATGNRAPENSLVVRVQQAF
jgi:phosphate-selective porin OprO and OprP